MGIRAGELALQRRITKAFIAADSLEVVLLRRTATDDGAGGTVYGPPAALSPQVMRLIPLGSIVNEQTTADGRQVTPTYALLGEHTADVQRWDQFEVDGHTYEVVMLQQNSQYEVKAEVAYRE